MDRFDERGPRRSDDDGRADDDGISPRRGGGRGGDIARSYAAYDDEERGADRFGQARRGSDEDGYPPRDHSRHRGFEQHPRAASYDGRSGRYNPYGRADQREIRRGEGGGRGFGWPSELGFPPTPGYSPYGNQPQRGADDREGGRSFFDRAGDEFMSWLGDRDARRRREKDHRGRGPKNYTRADERIREDVNDRLTEDIWVDASEIEVSVLNGEVTLAGTVEDRRSKRRAEDCAEDVVGVRHVQNNLRYTSGVVSPRLE
ncbi:hypothetical protein GGC65_003949 [Sphingopyxis sp. OAS728]|uniref:BON domain-containing protein n=1 Tax=Sphingopyxis sp. OAS728 TaxID=2663823 RepID=UPI00178BBED7|nr:BON domain-containing protein [Sphingopyxis sp. OAS728]MBE1529493.1 hypothetical protein [Sphingopyxis sp. OAS728]